VGLVYIEISLKFEARLEHFQPFGAAAGMRIRNVISETLPPPKVNVNRIRSFIILELRAYLEKRHRKTDPRDSLVVRHCFWKGHYSWKMGRD